MQQYLKWGIRMIIDKIETFILNIDQMTSRFARRKLLKLLNGMNLHATIQIEWLKHQQNHLLKIHLPKQALPYLISFLSFHHYRIYQIVPFQLLDAIKPLHQRPHEEHRFEMMIDGLDDPFIKDKVIDILNGFQSERIIYSFAKDILKVTTTAEVMSALVGTLATRNIDIYHANTAARCFHKMRIS